MNAIFKLLSGAALLPASLLAQELPDSAANSWKKELELNEVVIVARKTMVKQQDGKLTYIVKNDPYAKGLDGLTLLNRIPRVSVNNGTVSVAGKSNVRYIIDGVLMELDKSAMSMRLQNLQAENIEKIELLPTPPSRYAVEPNAVYISITTRDETLGTRGNIYSSLNQGRNLREYFSGSISHTTRHIETSMDASLSNYFSINDNYIEYQFADNWRRSSTKTNSHLFNSNINALLKYKISINKTLGIIANYNYETSSNKGKNITDYGNYTSSSESSTKSRPNNALTVTGFYDWIFGKNGERMELTYNYFNRHSPTTSEINTLYSNTSNIFGINEKGATDYRFNSGKADFKMPFPQAQIETGISYTDILNSSNNSMNNIDEANAPYSNESNIFDYNERIAAVYLTASRNLGKGIGGKIGLRYEYTWTKGIHLNANQTNRDKYGRLFPTFNLSWNKVHIGSFNFSYSMGMGRPNLWELNPFKYYSTIDEYAAGNPRLKPTIYQNAEINYYGLGGLYAVVYTSYASDAIGYIRRFDANNVVCTMPYNCLTTNKTGLFATYKQSLFSRWEMNLGGEIFRTYSHSNVYDFKIKRMQDWSGKVELSTNLFLNTKKTMIFNARFTHFFPWQQNLIKYKSFQLLNMSLRYSLLNNRLNLHLTANDIFGWNKTKSVEHYSDYTMKQIFNAHTAYVLFGVSYRFGRDKVSGVWRDSKENHSKRTK